MKFIAKAEQPSMVLHICFTGCSRFDQLGALFELLILVC